MFGLISEFFRSRVTLNYFLVRLSTPTQTDCWDSRNESVQVISNTKYKELTGLMSKEELKNPHRITTHRIKELSLKCNVPEEEINSLFKLFEINYRIPLPKDPIERIEFVYNYKR